MKTLVERLTALASEASLQPHKPCRVAAVSRLDVVLHDAQARAVQLRLRRSGEAIAELVHAAKQAELRLAYQAAQLRGLAMVAEREEGRS